MSIEFTKSQQEVIDLRGCNVLVSAAAGSGKTAVLTERIAGMVCDEAHPVDVDRLLVVTFTGAAAAEMRERIGNKLRERLSEHPESEHLQRQVTLLHAAQITTIDSFCLFLIKNHFHEIGLDPSFRVADEREIKLLAQEAMEELLEDAFAEGREEFLACVEALCPKGKEKVLEDHIKNLSRYASSFPWPEEWLKARKEDYRTLGEEDRKDAGLWAYFSHYVGGVLSGCAAKLGKAMEIAELPDGPHSYGALLERERDWFEDAAARVKTKGLEGLEEKLSAIYFEKLPGIKKNDAVDPEKKEQAKALRDDVKDIFSELMEQFFGLPFSVTQKRSEECQKIAGELMDLVLSFDRRMREKKQEKKLIDFSDMEHLALDILLSRDEEGIHPSRVALQYREYFQEILIDEYQDSNLVQEYLLRAVSGEDDGKYDRFMVGDVKQSIYHFRLARPELFLEKYGTYQKTGPERRIDLSKNFRSRDTVIRTVNRIFERTMSREVGGIVYDEDAALHLGAKYPENEGTESELLFVEKPGKSGEIKQRQAEALAVADRIRELMREGRVTDADTGMLRSLRYRDICILLRTLSGWGEIYKAALESRGIPAYVTSKSGYFTATEVQDVLNYLRVIDNPLQDVPLFGVMRSYFGGFTEEEIARLRSICPTSPLYENLKQSDDPKAVAFLERVEGFREKTCYLTIRTLLEKILWDYDYLNYATALPGGSKRKANLEMLLVKASDFEKTSFFGLFHFLRYVEMLEKYEEDYGEADALDENADVVRIMSIHKSKGLEFPVVFVSGLAKQFNLQDVTKAVIVDADLGLGMDHVDPARRLRHKTFRKNVISKKLREDTLAEELRLLYVALTRAREKLILTAEIDEPEKALEIAGGRADENVRLSYLEFMKAKCFLDFLLPILPCVELQAQVITLDALKEGAKLERLSQEISMETLRRAEELSDPEALRELKERFRFAYPFAALQGLYTKTTVSELKIAAMSDKDEAAFHAFEDREVESYVPEFRREKEEVSGTVRGNAYHRVMELLDFNRVLGAQLAEPPKDYEAYASSLEDAKLAASVADFMQSMVSQHRLSEEYRDAVRPERIGAFLRSELGWRAWRADRAGKLHREQPFVLSIPATKLKDAYPEEEKVLIQGIIDVYFEEGDALVLLDYKTDRIENMEALWNRYETQLDYYQEALERLTELPVKERILYSFHLGEY